MPLRRDPHESLRLEVLPLQLRAARDSAPTRVSPNGPVLRRTRGIRRARRMRWLAVIIPVMTVVVAFLVLVVCHCYVLLFPKAKKAYASFAEGRDREGHASVSDDGRDEHLRQFQRRRTNPSN